jgi:hypothetical protein
LARNRGLDTLEKAGNVERETTGKTLLQLQLPQVGTCQRWLAKIWRWEENALADFYNVLGLLLYTLV